MNDKYYISYWFDDEPEIIYYIINRDYEDYRKNPNEEMLHMFEGRIGEIGKLIPVLYTEEECLIVFSLKEKLGNINFKKHKVTKEILNIYTMKDIIE
jgi:hypothetical protein